MTLARSDGRGRELPLHADDEITLVDLLDRLLAGGVMLTGDITISLADVDLVHVSLRALISSVATLMEGREPTALPDAALEGADPTGVEVREVRRA
ncbi:gas vesicle protein [Pseudonocardia sp. RS11V-5]|uniref:gas vesicle protein n=1 Tax=Pseudonocardia terrae TaxID=2905831 RepID=UPI001E6448C7|nr:gas vesicle protein [Pseudonocardia terrae]MCE3553099.1 gas vesicle protein [Pseudonocardia terrae]